jgi:hypothetical protein
MHSAEGVNCYGKEGLIQDQSVDLSLTLRRSASLSSRKGPGVCQ